MAFSPCNPAIDKQKKELAAHGTPAFPIACYDDDLRQTPVPWHWHEELEAAVITAGSVILAAGSERVTLSAGEGFFLGAGTLHAVWPGKTRESRLHSVVFHPRLVGGGAESIFWQDYLRPVLANPALQALSLRREQPWMRECLSSVADAWRACAEEPPGYAFWTREALSRLIFTLSCRCAGLPQASSPKMLRDSERMKQMLQYIHTHFSESIDTAGIAASAAVSQSECLRCFHGTIGTTPVQYLRQYRLRRAAELLRDTDMKITEVAMQCGFREMGYFAKTFRALYGETPSACRKKARSGRDEA